MIYVLRDLAIVLYTIVLGTIALLTIPFDRSGDAVMKIGRLWVRWIVATCGLRIEAEGLENIPRDRPVIFMPNHQSLLDIVALVYTLPVRWRFVAKKELLAIPIFGWALAGSGQIIVDRKARDKAVRSLHRAAERIREGMSVIVFPEGTRSPDGQLGPFKSGGFYLALEAGVPIVPVSISGTHRLNPKHSLKIRSGTIKVVYGKPIPTEGLTLEDRYTLKERVAEAIRAGMDPGLQGALDEAPEREQERASA